MLLLKKLLNQQDLAFAAIIQLIFICIGLITENHVLFLVPVGAGIVMLSVFDVRWLYWAFAMVIPFSIEMELPGGLGLDMPSEPLMWTITGVAILYLIHHFQKLKVTVWMHPLSLLLVAHLMWILITTFTSELPVISAKFLIAKVWYTVPFYFLFLLLFRDRQKIELFFKIAIGFTVLAIVYVLVQHAESGFLFKTVNKAVRPIFRNHVSYAALLGVLFPYVFFLFYERKRPSWTGILLCLLFVAAIYFSYTRAIMGAILIGGVGFFVIIFRLTKKAILISIALSIVAVFLLFRNNSYLELAPDYERTITHYQFENLIEATYKLEDISTMERFYRWLAAAEMIRERPLSGFGPGTFYFQYKAFTLSSFQTYVSDNPDRSGIHNYFLMTLVEQGLPGLLIFLALNFGAMIYGEKVYHRLTEPRDRRLVMAAIINIIMITAVQLMNDLIETDKVGPFFFVSLAIITFYHAKVSLDGEKRRLSESSRPA